MAIHGTNDQDLGADVSVSRGDVYWAHQVGSNFVTSLLDAEGAELWQRAVPVPATRELISVHRGQASLFALTGDFLLERVDSDFGSIGDEGRSRHKVGMWSRTSEGEPRWLDFIESTVSVVAGTVAFDQNDQGCFGATFRGRLSYRGETLVGSSLDEDSAILCMDTHTGEIVSQTVLSGPGRDNATVVGLVEDDIIIRATTAGGLPWGEATLDSSAFLARVTRRGEPVWRVPYETSDQFISLEGATDSDIVAVSFYVRGTVQIHGVTFRYTTGPGSNGMMALVGLDARTGGLRWTAESSRSGLTLAASLALTERGVVVLGRFSQDGGLPDSPPPIGGLDFFVARFTRDAGRLSWARTLSGVDVDYARALSCTASGRCAVSFDFSGSPSYFGTTFSAEGFYDAGLLFVEVD